MYPVLICSCNIQSAAVCHPARLLHVIYICLRGWFMSPENVLPQPCFERNAVSHSPSSSCRTSPCLIYSFIPCQEQHSDVITKCALKSTWYKGLLQGFRPAKHLNTRVTLSMWVVVPLVSTTLHMCLSALLDRGPHLTDNSGYALDKEPLWHKIFSRKTWSSMQPLEESTLSLQELIEGFPSVLLRWGICSVIMLAVLPFWLGRKKKDTISF